MPENTETSIAVCYPNRVFEIPEKYHYEVIFTSVLDKFRQSHRVFRLTQSAAIMFKSVKDNFLFAVQQAEEAWT